MQPRSTPCHQREPFGQLTVPALLHMQEAKTGVQHAVEQVRERQLTEANAISQPPDHGPRTAPTSDQPALARAAVDQAILSSYQSAFPS